MDQKIYKVLKILREPALIPKTYKFYIYLQRKIRYEFILDHRLYDRVIKGMIFEGDMVRITNRLNDIVYVEVVAWKFLDEGNGYSGSNIMLEDVNYKAQNIGKCDIEKGDYINNSDNQIRNNDSFKIATNKFEIPCNSNNDIYTESINEENINRSFSENHERNIAESIENKYTDGDKDTKQSNINENLSQTPIKRNIKSGVKENLHFINDEKNCEHIIINENNKVYNYDSKKNNKTVNNTEYYNSCDESMYKQKKDYLITNKKSNYNEIINTTNYNNNNYEVLKLKNTPSANEEVNNKNMSINDIVYADINNDHNKSVKTHEKLNNSTNILVDRNDSEKQVQKYKNKADTITIEDNKVLYLLKTKYYHHTELPSFYPKLPFLTDTPYIVNSVPTGDLYSYKILFKSRIFIFDSKITYPFYFYIITEDYKKIFFYRRNAIAYSGLKEDDYVYISKVKKHATKRELCNSNLFFGESLQIVDDCIVYKYVNQKIENNINEEFYKTNKDAVKNKENTQNAELVTSEEYFQKNPYIKNDEICLRLINDNNYINTNTVEFNINKCKFNEHKMFKNNEYNDSNKALVLDKDDKSNMRNIEENKLYKTDLHKEKNANVIINENAHKNFDPLQTTIYASLKNRNVNYINNVTNEINDIRDDDNNVHNEDNIDDNISNIYGSDFMLNIDQCQVELYNDFIKNSLFHSFKGKIHFITMIYRKRKNVENYLKSRASVIEFLLINLEVNNDNYYIYLENNGRLDFYELETNDYIEIKNLWKMQRGSLSFYSSSSFTNFDVIKKTNETFVDNGLGFLPDMSGNYEDLYNQIIIKEQFNNRINNKENMMTNMDSYQDMKPQWLFNSDLNTYIINDRQKDHMNNINKINSSSKLAKDYRNSNQTYTNKNFNDNKITAKNYKEYNTNANLDTNYIIDNDENINETSLKLNDQKYRNICNTDGFKRIKLEQNGSIENNIDSALIKNNISNKNETSTHNNKLNIETQICDNTNDKCSEIDQKNYNHNLCNNNKLNVNNINLENGVKQLIGRSDNNLNIEKVLNDNNEIFSNK
ncbi:hypothetical protein COBT_002079, partial [Conglomerata obtusa]